MAHRTQDLQRAREATRNEAWAEAYEQLSRLEPSELEPEDLEALAESAYWLSRIDESLLPRQRAYSAYVRAGNRPRAAMMAWHLFYDYVNRGEPTVGGGWLNRAQRLLRTEPERVEHGYLACAEADQAILAGDFVEAEALAERSADIGHRSGDPDLAAFAIVTQGRALIMQGRLGEGATLLDEAMASVLGGELSTLFTGWIYCTVISACLELADLRRAGDWAEAAMKWCDSIPADSPFPGWCRIRRVEVLGLRGAWALAESEALRASEELAFSPYLVGEALYAVGEIRRRLGDLAGAEEAFAKAHELGREPQPGLALVRLAQGKIEPAAAAMRLSVAAESPNPFGRVRLLAAQIEVALAAGDLETAREACAELDAVAGSLEPPAFEAAAAAGRGAILLAEGDPGGALRRIRRAWTIWQDLKMPYEAAQARALIGIAARRAGDDEGAARELEAARAAFEALGAAGDARRVTEMLGERRGLPGGLTEREAEVLRLVAAGKSNREVAEELVISEHTVARHLQNIFAKLDVSSRGAATAFAFEHGLVSNPARGSRRPGASGPRASASGRRPAR